MDQLRAPDLYRFRQNYLTHKQKIKSIMNRSTDSVRSLTQSQAKLMTKNKMSHEKAFKWKHFQKQRQLNIVNNKFVNRIYENDQRRTKLFSKQINTSRSQILLAKNNFTVASARGTSSKLKQLQKDNFFIARKLTQVKSTISCKDFHKEYSRHAERSSSMSKFKIDARSFKFIPKNQILLQRIDRVKSNLSSVSSSKLLSSKLSSARPEYKKEYKKLPQENNKFKPKINNALIKLSFSNNQTKKLQFKNIKLEKLNLGLVNQKKTVGSSRQSVNPQIGNQIDEVINN